MGIPFDELAKAVARKTSRRSTLRMMFATIIGGAAAKLIFGSQSEVAEAGRARNVADSQVQPWSGNAYAPPFNQALCINPVYFNMHINMCLPTPTPTATWTVTPTASTTETATPTATPEVDRENKDDSARPKTDQQRYQEDHTNASSSEDERTEGNVIAVNLDDEPPTITIANRDGLVTIVLQGDAIALGAYVQVGDYMGAFGEKQHELLFWATDIWELNK